MHKVGTREGTANSPMMGPQVNSKDASTGRVTSAKDRMDELHTELWEPLSCPEVYPTEVTGPHYSFFPFLASGELILMLLEEWTCPQSSEFSWAHRKWNVGVGCSQVFF